MKRFTFAIIVASALAIPSVASAQPRATQAAAAWSFYGRPFHGGLHYPWHPGHGFGYGYGYGGALYGQAEIVRAYGTVLNDVESARIRREEATRAKLETQRQRLDLQNYLRANTPTYAQEQAEAASRRLERIRTSALPAEIESGFALNVLLDHVRGAAQRNQEFANRAIPAEVIAQLNVTSSTTGIGALRQGKVSWPVGLQTILSIDRRQGLEAQAQALYRSGLGSTADANVYRDFTAELQRIQQSLIGAWDKVGGPQYLEAKRFVSDLLDSAQALAQGQARHQTEYEAWVETSTSKTAHEILDYLVARGLRFAPASGRDTAAYRAVYSALTTQEFQRSVARSSVAGQ